MIRSAMSSVSSLFIAQMQDYLGLGSEGRINTPGTSGTNWTWRLKPGQITDELADSIYDLALMYQRCEKRKEKTEEPET